MKDKSLIESTTEQEINKLTKENKELKEMLKQAIKDFEKINSILDAAGESYEPFNCNEYCERCPLNSDNCRWKFEKQALKLIGGDE